MRNITLLIPFVFAVAITCQSFVLAQPPMVSSRSATNTYLDGGLLNISNVSHVEKKRLTSQARDYVWSRWTQGLNGKIRVRHVGIDGPITTTTFRIIRNSNGELRIEVKVEERGIWLWSHSKVVSRSLYLRAERVELMTDSTSSEIPKLITVDTKREPSSYAIRLVATNRADDFLF